MNTSAKLNHKEVFSDINFQISLEYKISDTEPSLLDLWDQEIANAVLKELVSFSKVSISGLPDLPVLTLSFEVLSLPAYLWEEVLPEVKKEAEKVNSLIKPFLSVIIPVLAPILFQPESLAKEDHETVKVSSETKNDLFLEDTISELNNSTDIDWSQIYNYSERESATEEV